VTLQESKGKQKANEGLYNLLLNGGALLLSPMLLPWILLSEKRRKTIVQRLWLGQNTPESDHRASSTVRPIWIHALSVGEMLSAMPLVSTLPDRFPGRPVVVTASTRTGYDIARDRLENKVDRIHFFPHDFKFSVRRAAATIDPALVVLVETDLWPNFLTYMKRHHVPVVLANSRLSQRSFNGYRRFSFFMGRPLSSLAAICAQSAEDGRRFEALGVPAEKIQITGNLKFDRGGGSDTNRSDTLPRDEYVSPNEKVLVAGSTHPGEEAILVKNYIRLKNRHPGLRLIIAPRDPRRAESIIRMVRTAGIHTSLLEEIPPPSPMLPDSVVVVGKMGLLKRLYSLADFAFVGGSLVSGGGHNPLEAAALGKPVLFGRDMSDFREIAAALETAGGAVRLENGDALFAVLDSLLGDPIKTMEMGSRALDMFLKNGGALEKTLAVINRFLVPK
jgi:3-deoxy-D-manno-octulosonic-acid transferase